MKKSAPQIGTGVCAAPKVSVIIPVYNVAEYVAETLESVFAQTFQNYEIILVNDGSTDADELKSVLAPRLDSLIYIEQENAGCAAARNTAIEAARGELLAFLDGDDVWLPNFLRSQIEFLESNDQEMVYCDARLFGDPFFENQTFMQGAPSNGAVTTLSLMTAECNVINSGTVLKKSLLDRFGGFDPAFVRAQDFDMWFRLAKNDVRIGYQREVLLKYRVRPGSLTGNTVDRAERNLDVMNLLRDKYDLDENEKAAWENQMLVFKAECELERGKMCLADGDYSAARAHLVAANGFYRKPKLSLIVWLLQLSPRLTARLFKTLRPTEYSFVAGGADFARGTGAAFKTFLVNSILSLLEIFSSR